MSRRAFAIFVLAIGLVYFSALGTIPLLEPDEARYAEIPREMLATGDFVTPHLNGVAYLEKPPLFYWGNALSIGLLGETESAARLFTSAVSVAGILLVYWMGTALSGWRTGLFSSIVLSTSLYHYVIGRLNTPDMALAVFLSLAIFPAYLHLSGKKGSRGYLVLSYAGMGAAFLTKGLIGVVFPPAILVLWMLFTRRHREILRIFSLPGILLFLAISLPWVILVQRANRDFLWFFFVREHFLRYATKMHGRYQPPWFFLPIVAAGLLPWLAFLHRASSAARAAAGRFLAREDLVFLLCWSLFILVFFSVSRSKLVTYAAPVFPPLAVLLGRALDLWAEREEETRPVVVPIVFAVLLGAGIVAGPLFSRHKVDAQEWMWLCAFPVILILLWGAVPLFARRLGPFRVVLTSFLLFSLFLTSLNRPAAHFLGSYKSVKRLSAVLSAAAAPGDLVAQYRSYAQGVAFYAKRRTVVVGDMGELEFGANRAKDRADYFVDDDRFRELWVSPARVFCVAEHVDMPRIAKLLPSFRLLYRTDEGILIVNRE